MPARRARVEMFIGSQAKPYSHYKVKSLRADAGRRRIAPCPPRSPLPPSRSISPANSSKPGAPLEVRNPATGELVGDHLPGGPRRARARDRGRRRGPSPPRGGWPATSAATRWRTSPSASRSDADELAELLTRESGKPIRTRAARSRAARSPSAPRPRRRCASTASGCPLDWNAANRGRSGIVRRYPIGPVAGISPFNFPLNLAAHKVAPAIAAGCSIVLKPPSKDPLVMLRVARLPGRDRPAARAPSASCPWTGPPATRMVRDDRFKLLSFTGSPIGRLEDEGRGRQEEGRPGARRQRRRDRRRDRRPRLGGRRGWSTASFAYAGQVCISVQRIYVVEPIYDEFAARFIDKVRGRAGRQTRSIPATDLGPMVDDKAVARTHAVGAARRSRTARAPWPAASRTASSTRRPCSSTCRRTRASAARRSSRRSSTSSRVAGLRRRPCARSTTRSFGLQCGVFTNDLERTLLAPRRAGGRRRHRQRRPDLADRRHAVRRREGLRPRPRGPALVDRGHDRAAPAGLRPPAVGAHDRSRARWRPRYALARLLPADELRDGELIPVEIDGTPVVLVRHAG